jgi:hypothetical protein
LEHLGVLNGDGCGGDFGLGGVVFHEAGVHGVDAHGGDGADQHGDGSVFGNPGGTVGSVLPGVVVGRPGLVEAHDFAFYFVFVCLQLLLVSEDDHFGSHFAECHKNYPEMELPRPMSPNF